MTTNGSWLHKFDLSFPTACGDSYHSVPTWEALILSPSGTVSRERQQSAQDVKRKLLNQFMLVNEELVDKIDTKSCGDGSNNVFAIQTLSLKSSTKPGCFKSLDFIHLQSVPVEISSSPEKYYKLYIHQECVIEGMMPEEPKAIVIEDTEWGCIHSQCHYQGKDPVIITYIVDVNNTDLMATKLVDSVLNTPWISPLDIGTQRPYKVTVKEMTDPTLVIWTLP